MQLFTNNAVALLDADVTLGSTVIQVQPGLGDLFPSPGVGDFFLVTLEDVTSPFDREIIKIASRTSDTLFIDPMGRGWEGTLAQDWSAGQTLVDHRITAGTLASLQSTGPGSPDARVYDAPFTLGPAGATTPLQLGVPYVAGSTAVWVSGVRQKRGVDYTEVGGGNLLLAFPFDQDDIDDGQNIVVDYTPS